MHHFYLQPSIPVCEAAQSNNLAPRIGVYDNNQFFIFAENSVLCKTDNFPHAVFLMFSSYYTFYLEYPHPVKGVFWFMQDYIFSYPDSCNRSASYLATTSDIKHCLKD